MSKHKPRIALFSGQDLAFGVVTYLASRSDIEVFVVTETTVRDRIYGYRSGRDACVETGTPFMEASRANDAVINRIGEFNPDIVLTAYYPHLLPARLYEKAPLGGANVHPGVLPFYRGRFPTPWYILNGEREYGVALHRLADGADTGDLFVQNKYPLRQDITGFDLYRETMDRSLEMVRTHLDSLLSGALHPVPQTGFGSCYNSIEKRFQIDWNSSACAIERRVRVHARPYLPAFTYLFNRVLFVNKATIVDGGDGRAQGGGRLLRFEAGGAPVVSCADGCLRLDEFEMAPSLSSQEKDAHLFVGVQLG